MRFYKAFEAGKYLESHGMNYYEARRLIDRSTPDQEITWVENDLEMVIRRWSQDALDKLMGAA